MFYIDQFLMLVIKVILILFSMIMLARSVVLIFNRNSSVNSHALDCEISKSLISFITSILLFFGVLAVEDPKSNLQTFFNFNFDNIKQFLTVCLQIILFILISTIFSLFLYEVIKRYRIRLKKYIIRKT